MDTVELFVAVRIDCPARLQCLADLGWCQKVKEGQIIQLFTVAKKIVWTYA